MATMVPAMKAFCMKSYCRKSGVAVPSLVCRCDEHVPLGAHHQHRKTKEPGEHIRLHHLVGGTDHAMPSREVQDAIHAAEERIDVVGHEQNGDVAPVANLGHKLDNLATAPKVQVCQWLVEEQQIRL